MSRTLGVLGALLVLFASGCSGGGNDVPYKDPRSDGAIVFFDRDGQPQTSGKVSDKPFVAKAVSQAKAPAPYDKEGRKATLLAFQPREGMDPARWSGTFLTGANTYPDAGHPTVVAPAEGLSLAEFLKQYPAEWKGLVQLRMFLGAPGESTRNDAYATADLRVDGDRWTLLTGEAKSKLALAAMAEPNRDGTSDGVPITVTVEGSPTGSPSPSASPSASASASASTSASATAGASASPSGPLPRTGSDIVALAGTGVFLVVTGTVGVVLGRRRNGGAA